MIRKVAEMFSLIQIFFDRIRDLFPAKDERAAQGVFVSGPEAAVGIHDRFVLGDDTDGMDAAGWAGQQFDGIDESIARQRIEAQVKFSVRSGA